MSGFRSSCLEAQVDPLYSITKMVANKLDDVIRPEWVSNYIGQFHDAACLVIITRKPSIQTAMPRLPNWVKLANLIRTLEVAVSRHSHETCITELLSGPCRQQHHACIIYTSEVT